MRKKILVLIIVFIFSFVLIACDGFGTGSGAKTNEGLVISKVYGSTDVSNNVIELYNNSSVDVDLTGHTLDFYTNGSETISKTIDLEGKIKSKTYYLIAGNDFDKSLLPNGMSIDLTYTSGNMPYNGNDAIQLSYKNNAHDVVGIIGIDIMFVKNLTLIRLGSLDSYKADKNYNRFNFISYVPDVFQYLGNDTHEIKTLEQLLAGPKLEQRYKDLPFLDPDNETIGKGGAAKVTRVSSIADGDTATFITDEEGVGGNSFRYYYINTPEVNGTYVVAEPWGYVASKYNKEYQLNNYSSKEIYIQSIPGYSLTETYGRDLGLVWINDALSQFLIVSEGLSVSIPTTFDNFDIKLTYKNVPYLTFMQFAEERARQNGWGVFGYPGNPDGEKSPDWNYKTNKSTTTNPSWVPHLAIPWD